MQPRSACRTRYVSKNWSNWDLQQSSEQHPRFGWQKLHSSPLLSSSPPLLLLAFSHSKDARPCSARSLQNRSWLDPFGSYSNSKPMLDCCKRPSTVPNRPSSKPGKVAVAKVDATYEVDRLPGSGQYVAPFILTWLWYLSWHALWPIVWHVDWLRFYRTSFSDIVTHIWHIFWHWSWRSWRTTLWQTLKFYLAISCDIYSYTVHIYMIHIYFTCSLRLPWLI